MVQNKLFNRHRKRQKEVLQEHKNKTWEEKLQELNCEGEDLIIWRIQRKKDSATIKTKWNGLVTPK